MRKFTRLEAPCFLTEKWEDWGIKWKERLDIKSNASFNWRQIDNEKVHDLLLTPLKKQTDDHCSFCDAYPVAPPGIDTIEHFQPKRQYPLVAYKWENLYFCCNFCQQKNDDYSDLLLRPDDDDYTFNRYFIWDYTKGLLQPNPNASTDDQERAEVTIKLYFLNEGHPSYRKREQRQYGIDPEPIDTYAYREFLI